MIVKIKKSFDGMRLNGEFEVELNNLAIAKAQDGIV